MIALRHLLAPAPRVLTPDRTALAGVAAFAAAATAPVIASIPDVQKELHDSRLAALVVVLVTVGLSALLVRRALRARSSVHARAWLLCGGFVAGSLDAALSYAGVVLLRPSAHVDVDAPHGGVLLGCLALGGPLGCLFGVAYAPVVVAAVRARLAPSLDAADRVLFAAGASLLALGGLWRLAAPVLSGPPTCAPAAFAGALVATLAAARLVARVRLLDRARDGAEPGLHVVPRSGREDESALVPLVRTGAAASGVLSATGISAPYRGARGVFKLALAPLPEEPFHRPILGMVGGALGEIGHTMTTIVLGMVGIWIVGMIAFFALLLGGPFPMG